jgi:hypothetical protein
VKTLRRFLSYVFTCRHSQLSRVFTIQSRTYKVCLKCGSELIYSWELMRPVKADAVPARRPRFDGNRRLVSCPAKVEFPRMAFRVAGNAIAVQDEAPRRGHY